ncbi:MAG: hypothetical protein A2Z49_10675 [Chloroflexi bacterium RBG_19FT_COMBO_56_12]|nr:MAG: hypothetical protein A2Z49_10675 [Chloroflexi bacterium RBG_19FT_COMBO_56_12]
MITVTLFSRDDCHLCEEALANLEALQTQIPHRLDVVNVDGNRDLQRAYGLDVPVVEAGPYRLKAPFTKQELEVTLRAAAERAKDIESIKQSSDQAKAQSGWTISGADRFSYWLSNHYLLLINGLVVIYLGLPVLAPVFMVAGFTTPAAIIYRVYGAVCHQLAYRSWFLFGEQPAYPRVEAKVEGLIPYGQAIGLDENDQWGARRFIGNPLVGYKVGLCQRDVAIYGGILSFGLIFSLTGRRIKSLPWYIWIVIGIFPIGIDGLSQLLSQPPLNSVPPFSLFSFRESTPLLRTLTGSLFGATTAWFGFPLVEETMAETRKFMAEKFSRNKGKGNRG